jgi:hypothetical protein
MCIPLGSLPIAVKLQIPNAKAAAVAPGATAGRAFF